MKTLFLTTKAVFPPVGGSAMRNWQNMQAAMTLGPVAAVSIGATDTMETVPPGLELWRHIETRQDQGIRTVARKIARMVRPHRHPAIDSRYSRDAARELAAV